MSPRNVCRCPSCEGEAPPDEVDEDRDAADLDDEADAHFDRLRDERDSR